jgi:hypothetical protein
MTSILVILHYQPILHLLTNLIQFCPILTGPYILARNLNPPKPYILGWREYRSTGGDAVAELRGGWHGPRPPITMEIF